MSRLVLAFRVLVPDDHHSITANSRKSVELLVEGDAVDAEDISLGLTLLLVSMALKAEVLVLVHVGLRYVVVLDATTTFN